MDGLIRQLTITLRSMWKFRWLGLFSASVVAVVGLIVIAFLPDRYEASTRIYVNTASILKPLMTGMTVLPNDEQQIAMLSRLVVSRPNVEKLVQLVGLDAQAKSKPAYEALVDQVMSALKIQAVGKENLYTLSYRDVQPERAKRIVQLFSSMFIESGHGGKAADTDAAKKFIDEQIVIYEKKLLEAEGKLKEFKLKSLGVISGEGPTFFARIAETSALLERAQLDLREAENTRDAFRRGLSSEEASTTSDSTLPSASSAKISEVDARIDAMRRSLDVLLQRYTESHPDVKGTQRVIRELEDQRSQLMKARRSEGLTVSPLPTNTGPRASEQLKVSLASAEASVASLRARVAEYSNRYAKLKASATLVPQLEAEQAQLNRDYEVNKKNYESLVSRRESASISGEMQSVAGVADFRLIDPPRVSPGPVSPNRLLLFPAVLLLSLVAGVATAFVACELRPTFYDGRVLAEATGLPILGTVSMVGTGSQAKSGKKNHLKFLLAFAAMIGSYVVGAAAMMFLSSRAI